MSRKTKKASTTSCMSWTVSREREKYRLGNPWKTDHTCFPSKGHMLIVHYHAKGSLHSKRGYSWQVMVLNRYPLRNRYGNHFIGQTKTLKQAKEQAMLAFIAHIAQTLMNINQEHPRTIGWDDNNGWSK